MRILHLSSSDSGGAGASARRLHAGLLGLGVSSDLLVLSKNDKITNAIVKYPPLSEAKLYQKFLNRVGFPQTDRQRYWHEIKDVQKIKGEYECLSFASSQYNILDHELVKNADVIHLHWVAGFVDYKTFFPAIKKPLIWTLHDMNPFIGCFHYTMDAKANPIFEEICKADLSTKQKAIDKVTTSNLAIVTPSKWLMNESKASNIFKRFKHTCIPYGINCDVFKRRNKQDCLEYFNLPADKRILLFVCDDLNTRRKGFSIFYDALSSLNLNDVMIVAAGEIGNNQFSNIKFLGKISSEIEMSYLYNAADMFIIPSIEDNFPNVVLESLACGTPVIGFKIGGLPDVITEKNGILVETVNSNELKIQIQKWIDHHHSFNNDEIIIDAVKKYSLTIPAIKYRELYEQSINNFTI